MTTFKEQSEIYLKRGATRMRRPFRPATLKNYKSQIETHLLPLLGSLSLEDVGNKAVKETVAKLAAQGLSPKTIQDNLNLIKGIVASAVNENGDQLYPRTWNSEYIDAPTVEGQKQPTISAGKLQDAISKAVPGDKALYALLAGTGLRISEALALMSGQDAGIGNAWVPGESKLIIRGQRLGGTYDEMTVSLPKTKAGVREVDLSRELNDYLKKIFPVDAYAPMFPQAINSYRERLEANGIQEGFHSFRRFRLTHLDGANVPQGLQRFWTGHAAGNVHESYVKSGEKLQERKEWAEKAGLGFVL